VLANYWQPMLTWHAVILIVALFVVVRPAAVEASLVGSMATGPQRRLMSWFGIRGVGSFYYLMFALEHAPKSAAGPLIPLVIAVITASVIVHGISSTPLMKWYQRGRSTL
jgi:NhaP-type Na+/H+ or K+/H+ antiporter